MWRDTKPAVFIYYCNLYYSATVPFQWYGSCYWQVPPGRYSWDTAEDECQKGQGHLWTVNSHKEWDALFTYGIYMKGYKVSKPGYSQHFDPMDGIHFFLGMKNGEVG